jgi:hypothetical protein
MSNTQTKTWPTENEVDSIAYYLYEAQNTSIVPFQDLPPEVMQYWKNYARNAIRKMLPFFKAEFLPDSVI